MQTFCRPNIPKCIDTTSSNIYRHRLFLNDQSHENDYEASDDMEGVITYMQFANHIRMVESLERY